jgi:large subunit ribosomal protein L13
MPTRFLSAGEATALDKWHIIDAGGQPVGRVATKAANILSGKHRPHYAPFLITGDHVVIINADKVRLTGQKLDQKMYRWHTLYPGGLKEVGARKAFETGNSEMVLREAVLGMLPKNKLRKRMVKRLKIYAADQHPHAAQRPEPLAI